MSHYEKLRRIAANRRKSLHAIADKVAAGEALPPLEANFAAAYLHVAAEGIKPPKKPPGRAPKIPADVLLQYKFSQANGESKTDFYARMMSAYDIVDQRTLTRRIERLEKEHGHKFNIRGSGTKQE